MKPGSKSIFSIDSLILGIAGIALAASVFFIFEDGYLFGEDSGADLTPVGHFVSSQNDVRRRAEDGLAWRPASKKDRVYEGDSIFTGENSQAAVELDAGGNLTIDAKSLVVIRTRGSSLELDLQYGSLLGKVETETPIFIKQDGKRHELAANGAEIRIVRSKEAEETQIEVVKGEVKIKDSSKKVRTARQSEVMKIATAPHTKSSSSVDSTSSVFSPPVKDVSQNIPAPVQPQPPEPIQPEPPKELAAPSIAADQLNYEIPQETLARLPSSLPPGQAVEAGQNMKPFSWPAIEGAASYEVEVANNPEFKDSKRESVGNQTQYTPKEVRPGPLFMRVYAKAADGRLSSPSAPTRMNVMVPPPRINELTPVLRKFATEKELSEARHDFNLSWTATPFADRYELEWGADPQFSRSKKMEIKDTNKTIAVTNPMDYSFRVRALASDGQPISDFSNPGTASLKKELLPPPTPAPTPAPVALPVATPPPVPKPKKVAGLVKPIPPEAPVIPLLPPKLREPRRDTSLISMGNTPVYVNFKWKSATAAEYYTLQLSSDPNFENVVDEIKVNANSYVFTKKLPEGRIYWRVRSHGDKKESEWSPASDINVIYQ